MTEFSYGGKIYHIDNHYMMVEKDVPFRVDIIPVYDNGRKVLVKIYEMGILKSKETYDFGHKFQTFRAIKKDDVLKTRGRNFKILAITPEHTMTIIELMFENEPYRYFRFLYSMSYQAFMADYEIVEE